MLHKAGLPLWNSALPKPFNGAKLADSEPAPKRVVYFPSCINRTMGVSEEAGRKLQPLAEVFMNLCKKAGFQVIFPKNMDGLCCGMIWESKGMPEIADGKTAELEAALAVASEGGTIPVVCDQSPCLHRMRDHIKSMPLYEPAEFILDFLAPHLKFNRIDTPIAVHITFPELNAWGLRKLKPELDAAGALFGYSNSRTCEIGLTANSGIPYKSIAYLVNDCTEPLKE